MAYPIFDILPDSIRVRDIRGNIDADLVCDLSDELRATHVVICFNGGTNSREGFTVIKGAELLKSEVNNGRTITAKLMGYQTKSFEQTHVLAALTLPGFERARLLERPDIVERIKHDLLNSPPFHDEPGSTVDVYPEQRSNMIVFDRPSGKVKDGNRRTVRHDR